MTKTAGFSLLPSFIIISAALLAGCNDQGETQAHPTEPQVTVHVVESAPLAVTTELPGRTSAFRIAEVRPQVSGIVLKRNFTEGSDVEAGQSLYQIDPRPIRLTMTALKVNWQKRSRGSNRALNGKTLCSTGRNKIYQPARIRSGHC